MAKAVEAFAAKALVLPFLLGSFLLTILLLDGPGVVRQTSLCISALGAAWLAIRHVSLTSRELVIAIILATFGETIFSRGCAMYTYRYALIPAYVPPGHVLLYVLSLSTAQHLKLKVPSTIAVALLVTVGTSVTVAAILCQGDLSGAILWLWMLLFISRSPQPHLLCACWAYSILLEILGTKLGNWQWKAHVPFVGISSSNPPAGVAAFYALFDVALLSILRWYRRIPFSTPTGCEQAGGLTTLTS